MSDDAVVESIGNGSACEFYKACCAGVFSTVVARSAGSDKYLYQQRVMSSSDATSERGYLPRLSLPPTGVCGWELPPLAVATAWAWSSASVNNCSRTLHPAAFNIAVALHTASSAVLQTGEGHGGRRHTVGRHTVLVRQSDSTCVNHHF